MVRGLALTGAAARHHHARGRGTGRLTRRRDGLRTGGAVGLTGETHKGFRFLRALTRGRPRLGDRLTLCLTIAWPSHGQHDAEPQESQQPQLGEHMVRYHDKAPLTERVKGGIAPGFRAIGIPRKLQVHNQIFL
jgi:hypothetical protein